MTELEQTIEAFSQIRDLRRAKRLLAVAFDYATDYRISWDEFAAIVETLHCWHINQ